jgi:hypothetical protein
MNVVAAFPYCLDLFIFGKYIGVLSYNLNSSLGSDLNPGPPEYEAKVK